MIDAQAIEQTVLEQLEDLAVHGLEHLAALDPQADQFADVEKRRQLMSSAAVRQLARR